MADGTKTELRETQRQNTAQARPAFTVRVSTDPTRRTHQGHKARLLRNPKILRDILHDFGLKDFFTYNTRERIVWLRVRTHVKK